MSEDAAPPLRRVRWHHLVTPMLASLVLPLIVALLVIGWDLAGGRSFDYGLLRNFYVLCGVQALSQIGMLGAALWLLARISDPDLPARFVPISRRILLRVLGAAIAVMLLLALFEYLCDTFLHTHLGDDAARLPITPHTWRELPVGILVIGVLAPLSEEAYFRGLVMGWGRRHGGNAVAILVSSLLFGLVHLKWWTPGGLTGWLLTAELAAMGAVLALVALRTRSLFASAALHAFNNLSAVVVLFLFAAP
ncbi:MAG: CPBP family intramembrane metalloprotease [Alphaproteobacteria bacterium]|nr:CPBP family intramembrane metalloprotease [Alphaproteobacteria bacterium]